MKALVTGAGGFLGSHLTKRLLNLGHEVVAVDDFSSGYRSNLPTLDQKLDVIDASIEYISYEELSGVDVIFHLAAISNLAQCETHPYDSYAINLMETLRLLDLCRKVGPSKFIFASSSAVYENNTGLSHNETTEVHPTLMYSMSKKHGEDLCGAYSYNYSIDTTVLRFFNVYGPLQDGNRENPPIVPYFIKCIDSGEPPIIYGDGYQERAFVYVDDAIDACIKAWETKRPSYGIPLDIGTDKPCTIIGVLDTLANIMGKSPVNPTYKDPSTMWDNRYPLFDGENFRLFNKQKVRHEALKNTSAYMDTTGLYLQWKPTIPLWEGLKRCVEEYRKQTHSK